jgi:hypothetical protein
MEASIRNLRHFQRLRGFLNYFQINGGFFHYCGIFGWTLRLLKHNFREIEAFFKVIRGFYKDDRLFEDISKEIEASV